MSMSKLAAAIPHEYRQRILLEWIPAAKATMSNKAFEALWNAYFIYIDPNAVKKDNCPICLQNVLDNWKSMQKYLVDAEKEYNTLEKI
jgi:hypothetical protein